MTAPKILHINVETIKPGRDAAHERLEQGFVLAFGEAKVPIYYTGLTPATGGADVWYVSSAQSYAELEKRQEVLAKAPALNARIGRMFEADGEFLSAHRTMIAEFREDLSVGEVPDFPRVHGYRIWSYRIRAGHEMEFDELAKLYAAGARKSGMKSSYGIYSVTEGATLPLVLQFRAFRSMAEYDEMNPEDERVMGSMTSEEKEKMAKLVQASIISVESFTMMVSPKQSSVPAAFAQADPEFWGSNPVIAAMNAKKSAVTQAGAQGKKKSP
jgi:hypothetical protein